MSTLYSWHSSAEVNYYYTLFAFGSHHFFSALDDSKFQKRYFHFSTSHSVNWKSSADRLLLKQKTRLCDLTGNDTLMSAHHHATPKTADTHTIDSSEQKHSRWLSLCVISTDRFTSFHCSWQQTAASSFQ